jgi:hypothetical protein
MSIRMTLVDRRVEIVAGGNRLRDYLVETGPGHFEPEHVVCQAPDILGKGLDLGALDDRTAAMTAQFPNAAPWYLLQHERRMGSHDGDAVAVDEEIRNAADKRCK